MTMHKDRQFPTICTQCGRNNLPPFKRNMMGDIATAIHQRPDLTYAEIAEAYGVTERTVKRYAQRAGIRRPRGGRSRKGSDAV